MLDCFLSRSFRSHEMSLFMRDTIFKLRCRFVHICIHIYIYIDICWFAGNLSLCHLAVILPPITTHPVDSVKLMWFYISLQDFLYGLMIADLQSAWNQWLSRNVTCDLLPCSPMSPTGMVGSPLRAARRPSEQVTLSHSKISLKWG